MAQEDLTSSHSLTGINCIIIYQEYK